MNAVNYQRHIRLLQLAMKKPMINNRHAEILKPYIFFKIDRNPLK